MPPSCCHRSPRPCGCWESCWGLRHLHFRPFSVCPGNGLAAHPLPLLGWQRRPPSPVLLQDAAAAAGRGASARGRRGQARGGRGGDPLARSPLLGTAPSLLQTVEKGLHRCLYTMNQRPPLLTASSVSLPLPSPRRRAGVAAQEGVAVPAAMNGWLAACRLLSGRLVHPGSVPGPSRSVAAVAGLEVSWLPTPASTLTHCRVIFRERPHPPVTFLPVTSHLYPPSPRRVPGTFSPGAHPPLPGLSISSEPGPLARAQR